MPDVIRRPCRECGLPIEIDPSTLDPGELILATKAGFVHEVCPNQIIPETHTYRVEIKMWRDDEDKPVAGLGSTPIEAASFLDAIEAISASLNERWTKIIEMAPLIDEDPI